MSPGGRLGSWYFKHGHVHVLTIIREAWKKWVGSSIFIFFSVIRDHDGGWGTCCKALRHSQRVMLYLQSQRSPPTQIILKRMCLEQRATHSLSHFLSHRPLKPLYTCTSYTTSLLCLPSMFLFTSIPSLRTMSDTLCHS